MTTLPVMALLLVGSTQAAASDEMPGAAIYRKHCVSCHGAMGEGTDEHYPHRLAGELTVAELAAVIDERMPEDDPGKCKAQDAKRVAEYVYETFYSPIAQQRIKPARVELSRLTVRQHRETMADLVGSFFGPSKHDEKRGLAGEYFNSKRLNRGQRVFERTDRVVHFDFGEEAPDKHEKIKPLEYAIRWQGSVLAPETGEYEFIVKTDQGAKLWVNDLGTPLIDASVRSGERNDQRQAIQLLGGRVYAIRLDFFKSKERKQASISLEWKPPHLAEEVIPERYFSPVSTSRTFILGTPFPPDDRSVGYERGSAVSRAWAQATIDAAIEVAAFVIENKNAVVHVSDLNPERKDRVKEFCRKFAERAWRRPLSDDEKKRHIEQPIDTAPDLESGLTRCLLLILKSPHFLYRELGAPSKAYDVASQLSYGLWDSIPDEALLKAAGSDKLKSPDDLRQQAERMANDLRARAKVREFLHQWLKFEHFRDVDKDSKLFPEFNDRVLSDLRTSLDLFLDDVVWGEKSDFRRLLLDDKLFLNGELSKLYGGGLAADADFQGVSLAPEERAGILSHPYLMAGFAYTSTSSPIHRGVFVARNVLGRSLRPPPVAVAPLAVELHAELSTRERISLQTKPEACQSCHGMINPLGFTLENYDALGRYRREEQGKPIDASGIYRTSAGKTVKLDGVRDLAEFLAESDETHAAFIDNLFHYLIKQPIRAYPPELRQRLRESFVESGFNIRKLVIEIVVAAASAADPKES